MNPQLAEETERLRRSWARHPEGMLRDYMVAGIHDPRINPQSIRGRHFLIEALFGQRFTIVKEEEFRFGEVMKWVVDLTQQPLVAEDWHAIEHGLLLGADNAEGLALPSYVLQAFSLLPREAEGVVIPNYLRNMVRAAQAPEGPAAAIQLGLEVFAKLWSELLENEQPAIISVIEPACGSANDYRALVSYGLASHLNYLGFDLCEKNVANARGMFPDARFEVGNVFEIGQPDQSFDHCVVHDLLEHLSPAGLEVAIAELCRVTRHGIFVGSFQMHEGAEHIVRAVDDYHWNTLSLSRVRELFERRGAQTQAVHVNTWLKSWLGCDEQVYYDTAYDFSCWFPAN